MVRAISLGLQLQAQRDQTIKRFGDKKRHIKYVTSIGGCIKLRNWKEITER